jgi:hypothetical protein
MSAPVAEVVEQDQARDQKMPHYFCFRCAPPVGESGKAACGTVATRKGTFGALPDACMVCQDLWDEFWTCPDCGWQNWRRSA